MHRPLDVTMSEQAILKIKARYDEVEAFFTEHFGDNQSGPLGHNFFESPADFEEKIEGHLREKIEEVRVSLPGGGGAPFMEATIASPYRGLKLFGEGDQHVFFGRTKALHRAVRALQRQDAAGRPFLAVIGRSGVGKSSFVRAGLLPHITTTSVIPGVCGWRKALFEPSDSTSDLVGGLAAALCDAEALPDLATATGGSNKLAEILREGPAAAIPLIRQSLSQLKSATGSASMDSERVLLIIDPLEEVFTHKARRGRTEQNDAELETGRDRERRALARALHALCTSRLVWVVATLRNDFQEQSDAIQELRELKEGDGQYFLAPLTATEIAQAVLRPADTVGLRFEIEKRDERGRLDDELISAALQHTDPMPLLSYTLDQVFERSNAGFTRLMSFKAFDELGGVEGCLTRRADEAKEAAAKRMKGKLSDAWNKVFGHLVDVDADGRRVRTYARAEELEGGDASVLREELDRARLLITDKDDQGQPVVSIAHEAMLRQWRTLREWIDERAELLRFRGALAGEARGWVESKRNPDLLVLQGSRLARAEQFVDNPSGLELADDITGYVAENIRRRDEAKRARRARARLVLGAVCVAFVLAAVSAVVAAVAWRHAHRQGQSSLVRAKAVQSNFIFLLDGVKGRLDPMDPHDKELIEDIRERTVEYCRSVDTTHDTPDVRLAVSADFQEIAKRIADLGQYKDAAEIMAKSIKIYGESGAPDQSELAARFELLGLFRFRASLYPEAEVAYKESLRFLELTGQRNSPKWAQTQGGMASLLKSGGRYSLCAHKLADSVKVLTNAGPAYLPALAKQYDALADILRNLERYDESREASLQAIAIAEKLASKPSKDLVTYQSEYAVLLSKTDKLLPAEELLTNLVSICENNKFDDVLGQVLFKLARVQLDLGKFEHAEKSIRESETLLRKDKTHTRYAKCLEARSKLHVKLKRFHEAVADARTVVEVREAKLGQFNPDLADAHELLADALRKTGDAREAVEAVTHENEAKQRRREFHDSEKRDQNEINASPN